MRFLIPAAAAFGLCFAAIPASAQSATDDVRCLIASNVFAGAEKDPQKKQLAVYSRFFYLGRVDARLSQDQLKAQIVALSKALNPQALGQAMTDCARRLQGKEMQMQEIGKQLAAMAPKPAAPAAK